MQYASLFHKYTTIIFFKINLSIEWNNEVHCLEHSDNNYSNNNNNIQPKRSKTGKNITDIMLKYFQCLSAVINAEQFRECDK